MTFSKQSRHEVGLGFVMVDVQGTQLNDQERDLLMQPSVGAVILFTRNFESMEQLRQLTADIHALREPSLLIAVDHEGGRVQRFREGFTRLPSAARIGAAYDQSPERGLQVAQDLGWLMAVECLATGIDFSFAPILDVDVGISSVIGDRSFHANPEKAAELALGFQRGMMEAGMAATGKHFPGHGGVVEDSHLALPVDQRDMQALEAVDLKPFQHSIEAGLAAIMPAHVVYAQMDEQPAGFSRFWLQKQLRQRFGFQGVIFSDDLSMQGAAVAGGPVDRARQARAAGCDVLLVCNQPDSARAVVEVMNAEDGREAASRLETMRPRQAWTWPDLQNMPRWQQAVALAQEMID